MYAEPTFLNFNGLVCVYAEPTGRCECNIFSGNTLKYYDS